MMLKFSRKKMLPKLQAGTLRRDKIRVMVLQNQPSTRR
jgi:hypothetical protein